MMMAVVALKTAASPLYKKAARVIVINDGVAINRSLSSNISRRFLVIDQRGSGRIRKKMHERKAYRKKKQQEREKRKSVGKEGKKI